MPYTASKKYKVILKRDYVKMFFTFPNMNEASNFAWTALEQTEDKIEAQLEMVREEE